jgi:hypothetical protein
MSIRAASLTATIVLGFSISALSACSSSDDVLPPLPAGGSAGAASSAGKAGGALGGAAGEENQGGTAMAGETAVGGAGAGS